jgi:glutamate synthase domain-containing protein 3
MKTINAQKKDLKAANQALKSSLNDHPVTIRSTAHIHGLAAGLNHGNIIVEENSGDYLGVLNSGATIHLKGDSGKYLADNMTGGTVIVEGNAGFGAAQYCYGGTVVIRGDSGDFTATMNKGATIIVEGNVGDEAGTYMLKGDLIVIGDAGDNFANYLIRGNVYLGGDWKSLGHNTRVELINDEDIAKLKALFETYQINANPSSFKKIVAASLKPFYH